MAGEIKDGLVDERLLFRRDFDAPPLALEGVVLAPPNHLPIRVLVPSIPQFQWRLTAWRDALVQLVGMEQARGALFHLIPVFLGAGSVVYFLMDYEPIFAPIIFLVVAFSLGTALASERPVLRAVMMAGALSATGTLAAKFETFRQETILLGDQITTRVTGRILSIEKVGRGYRAVVEIISTEKPVLKYQPERMKITLRKAPFGLQAGDGIKALFLLRPPTGPVRPGSFDFAFDSYFDRIGATGISLSDVEKAEIASASFFARSGFWFERQRTIIAEHVRRRITGQSGEMSAALITGLTGGIDADTNEAMRVSGLAHVTSISGLHMALVAGVVMGFVRLLLAAFPAFSSHYPTKKIAALLAFFASFAYLLLSGGGVATLRSFIMLGVMLIAVMFDQAALTMRNLVISAIIILIVVPHEVMGPSFQMSFAATAALIACYQMYTERRIRLLHLDPLEHRFWPKAWRQALMFFVGLAATSLIAGTATAIYSAYHFNRIAPMGLFANLAAMPAVSIIVMPMALLSVLLMPFGLDGIPLYLMGKGVDVMLNVADRSAALSPLGASGLMPGNALLAFTVGLAVFCLLISRMRLLALPLLALGGFLTFTRILPDVMISEDAKLVAVLGGQGEMAVNRDRPSRFTSENWQRAYLASTLVLPKEDAELSKKFECSESYCVAENQRGLRIAHVEDRDILNAACIDANLVIAAFPVPKWGCGKTGAYLISARDLARKGSAEVYVKSEGATGFNVVYAFPNLDRPWHQHRAFSRAARNKEPYQPRPKALDPIPAPPNG